MGTSDKILSFVAGAAAAVATVGIGAAEFKPRWFLGGLASGLGIVFGTFLLKEIRGRLPL